MYGKMSLPTVSHYVTTKHGLNGLTKALAAETGEPGIRVNAICPGFIRTDIFETEGPVTAAAMGMEFEDWGERRDADRDDQVGQRGVTGRRDVRVLVPGGRRRDHRLDVQRRRRFEPVLGGFRRSAPRRPVE